MCACFGAGYRLGPGQQQMQEAHLARLETLIECLPLGAADGVAVVMSGRQ